MDKLQPKAVIFDLGSTLIEYEAIPWNEMNVRCVASAREYLVKEGYDLPDEQEFNENYEQVRNRYRERAAEKLIEWTVPQAFADLLSGWNIATDEDTLDRLFLAYYNPLRRRVYPYQDVVPTLEKIRQKYPVVGLISNTIFPEQSHRQELKRFGIEPYLDFAIFSSTFGLRKPHPDIFYKAVNLAGYAPSECVYVGDRYLEDVQGPAAVGMPSILKMKDGREYPEDALRDIRAITTLSELDAHLDLSDTPG